MFSTHNKIPPSRDRSSIIRKSLYFISTYQISLPYRSKGILSMLKAESYLFHELRSAEYLAAYDRHAKRLLKDKGILARILIETVPEFFGYTPEEAIAAIEGEPMVSSVPVRPYSKEAVAALNNESALPGEGTVTFDIVFTAVTKDGIHTKLYINLEAQKDFYPGYDLVTRGIVYGARLISQQMDVEYTPDDYSGVKKIYSIWICMNTPSKNRYGETVSDSILEYSIRPSVRYCRPGDKTVDPERWRYDLMSVIFICLGPGTDGSENKIINMLSVLLSPDMRADEKKNQLEGRFHLPMTKYMEKEVSGMCNLSLTIASETREELEAAIAVIAEKDTVINTIITEKDTIITEKDTEIAALREKLKRFGVE